MKKKEDETLARIKPLLLQRTLSAEEIAYWRAKEPWNFEEEEQQEKK